MDADPAHMRQLLLEYPRRLLGRLAGSNVIESDLDGGLSLEFDGARGDLRRKNRAVEAAQREFVYREIDPALVEIRRAFFRLFAGLGIDEIEDRPTLEV